MPDMQNFDDVRADAIEDSIGVVGQCNDAYVVSKLHRRRQSWPYGNAPQRHHRFDGAVARRPLVFLH
jgi:hypothetical protein